MNLYRQNIPLLLQKETKIIYKLKILLLCYISIGFKLSLILYA